MNEVPLKNMTGLIGLTGFAGSGKDLLFSEVTKRYTSRRFALADRLKAEIRPYLLECFGIDILTAPREQKNLVRDILVAHGKVRRILSKGTHWTSLITPEINENKTSTLCVVTDIRYAKFEKDEHNWLHSIGGTLVHIKKYKIDEQENITYQTAPNSDEAENDPLLALLSEYEIEWPDMETCPIAYKTKYEEKYKEEISKFFEWLEYSSK